MAETPVEVVIRARNEAQAALNQAVGQMKQLEGATKAAGAAGPGLRGLRDAVSQISPAAGAAVARMESLAGAGAALGPAAVAAGAVAAGIGLIAAAAVTAAKSLADTVEQLDNLSLITGTSVGDIQVLSELFERQGLGADVARTALHKLNVAIGEGNPLLAKLGVTSRDTLEALMQLSDAFNTSSDTGLRAKVAQELLGRGGKDLLAVLDTLRESFPRLNKEMEATRQKFSPEMVEAGRALDKEFERVAGRWEGNMNRMKEAAGKLVVGLATLGPAFLLAFVPAKKLQDLAATDAWAKYRKNFEPVVDLLARATKEHEKASTAVKLHNERVRELVTLFGLEKKAAEEVITAQERLERFRRKEALEKDLFEPKAIPGIEVKAKRTEEAAGIPGLLPSAEAREQMLANWRSFIDEVTSSARVLDESINSLAFGLASGFTTVFQGLLASGQTFRSAMVTIFRSMVNELLAQLARLLAFKLIGFLIGSPLPLNALRGAANFTPPIPGLRGASAVTGTSAATGGNTYIIQAIDAHDAVASLTLPGGSLRRAQDRIAAAGAY